MWPKRSLIQMQPVVQWQLGRFAAARLLTPGTGNWVRSQSFGMPFAFERHVDPSSVLLLVVLASTLVVLASTLVAMASNHKRWPPTYKRWPPTYRDGELLFGKVSCLCSRTQQNKNVTLNVRWLEFWLNAMPIHPQMDGGQLMLTMSLVWWPRVHSLIHMW